MDNQMHSEGQDAQSRRPEPQITGTQTTVIAAGAAPKA